MKQWKRRKPTGICDLFLTFSLFPNLHPQRKTPNIPSSSCVKESWSNQVKIQQKVYLTKMALPHLWPPWKVMAILPQMGLHHLTSNTASFSSIYICLSDSTVSFFTKEALLSLSLMIIWKVYHLCSTQQTLRDYKQTRTDM